MLTNYSLNWNILGLLPTFLIFGGQLGGQIGVK